MAVTIKDVAKKANVSIATVSYSINGSSRISDATREHVLKIASELNYVANNNAKQLKQKKSNVIGLFFNSWFGPVYSELVKGIEQVCHQNGYDLVACSVYGNEDSTAHKYIRNRMVDGAIILSNSFDDEFLKSIAKKDFPVVVLDREVSGPYIYNILIDNFGGAFSATKALINSGCREIYYFGGPEDSYDAQKRLDGYISALGYHKIKVEESLLIEGDFTERSAYTKMLELIEEDKQPKAVFASNDEMAIGIIRAAKEKGIAIPEDMKLVGFDDIQMAELMIPRLSTISHQKVGMGEIAAKTLIDAMNSKDDLEDLRILPTKLILRETL
ncbi:LacI-family regulatory protein [Vibrio coralliirubri]|uniref:LacI family DNA-binding transcriptional regulator n=1 Tax=Vibrio coralliirubri TaxID=1516159 RepID=UPI0006383EC2|nr:LacI family DNA-binding transcriptional regulator [Vibrio coralliirubri]CDT71099.1 LacI-family regulatory protein [Vibrio coralliirubri]